MAFMNAEVTDKIDWVSVDSAANGTTFIRADVLGFKVRAPGSLSEALDRYENGDDAARNEAAIEIRGILRPFCEPGTFRAVTHTGDVPDLRGVDIEILTGYGVRASASGYLDCTPWTVYSTKAEALRAAREEQRQCEGVD